MQGAMHRDRLHRLGVLLLLAVLSSFIAASAAEAKPAVTVEKRVPKIKRRTFDPQKPPADLPELKPTEAGLCQAEFLCETQVAVDGYRSASEVQFAVTTVRVTISLNITIWTQGNASPKLVAHEETHREIAEVYYREADAIAQRLAEKLIGKRFVVPLDDKAATLRVLGKMQDNLIADYLHETAKRCTLAEDQFDLITHHGLLPIPASEARDRALDQEEKSKWKG